MATKRLLVDAIHPEETRIVVTNGNRLEEFDFESATRRQLRGNIYLAKVTRVEPSLQAAFVEYGGNRHGFLAFSEIHPDYYQIPVADREALMREQEAEEAAEAEAAAAEEAAEEAAAAASEGAAPDSISEAPAADAATAEGEDGDNGNGEDGDAGNGGHVEEAPAETEPVESVGSGDALEDIRERPRRTPSRRNYKIQEVIKRRQVMLVQVVKEERGNKGAALTTYLSLAGRYSVLMPNTARGGGISRKITNAADRKRLKEIVGDLDIPPGQGIILRTAGASRTKAEVKRDFEYLQRLWENVRSLTLRSTAPCLVYEEGSLIKRTIRDLYSKDIDEVWVAGEEAYREAKDFMRMIMPSHAKNVQLYKDDQPIFSRYGVESQLDSMFSPQVTLPSGGYIVINPTEALVSIDVNSGRATKEHNIEDTALQTNLEAAEEIARQLRLRDLAGLIVIDFIDMVENRSNRAVERKLKDCLKNDRARIQVGRISHFGLMEMSRQRIRFGVIESSTHKCPVCAGTGIVRSTESIALMVMRAIEDHVLRKPGQSINVKVPTDVALYILNGKRGTLTQLEQKYGLSITLVADDHIPGAHYLIERGEPRFATDLPPPSHVRVDSATMDEMVEEDEEAEDAEEAAEAAENGGERQGRRRRRRRGRGGERDAEARVSQPAQAEGDAAGETDDEDEGQPQEADARRDDGEEPRRRRRRGRRGGRRNRRPETEESALGSHGDADAGTLEEEAAPAVADVDADDTNVAPDAADEAEAPLLAETAEPEPAAVAADAADAGERPRRARRRRIAGPAAEGEAAEADVEPRPRARRSRAAKAAAPADESTDAVASPAMAAVATVEAEAELPLAPPADAEESAAAPEPAAAAEPEPPAPAPGPQPEQVTADAEETQASRARRKELPPDEIIVSSTSPVSEERPRRGWWQRGFFGS